MKKHFGVVVIAFFIFAVIFSINTCVKTFLTQPTTNSPEPEKKIIVVDVGHGGFDPGKVGVNGDKEKDINLSIALKLEQCLKDAGFEVVMTRTTDTGLYSDGDKNKKRTDMSKRVEIVNGSNACIAVSIHQNSFSQESSKGAQVFYHQSSEDGKVLAEMIQETIKEEINDGNHRMAKANDTYYLLKKTQCPLVIIECGFMSNREEAELLKDASYQEKMATAMKDGIMKYLEQNT